MNLAVARVMSSTCETRLLRFPYVSRRFDLSNTMTIASTALPLSPFIAFDITSHTVRN